MKIKSSNTLVEEAEKTIKTLTAEEVAKFVKKDEIKLIDVRDIRELWKEGTIKGVSSYSKRHVRILAGSRKFLL